VNLRYGGTYWDQETQLLLNGARYYDPKTGRFITADPMSVAEHVQQWQANLGTPGQPPLELNPYARVVNNPLRWIDPDGQNTIAIGGGIGAAIGGPPGAVIGAGIGAAIGVGSYLIYQQCKDKECPPCTPPVGTIGYRMDVVPPSKPHHPLPGTHVHLYKMNQNPNNCQCFWQPIGVTAPPPPPGAVPL
jgi:RHS repeat-associated protein